MAFSRFCRSKSAAAFRAHLTNSHGRVSVHGTKTRPCEFMRWAPGSCAIIAPMLSRTKIIATLGPATDNANTLLDMINVGLDVARLNFSHGDHDAQRERLELLRDVAAISGRHLPSLSAS